MSDTHESSEPQGPQIPPPIAEALAAGPHRVMVAIGGISNPLLISLITGELQKGNPYDANDPRHGLWQDAMRDAQGKYQDLWYRAGKEHPLGRDPQTYAQIALDAAIAKSFGDHSIDKQMKQLLRTEESGCFLRFVIGNFDVWAELNLRLVVGDAGIDTYDQLLQNSAGKCIDLVSKEDPEVYDLAYILEVLQIHFGTSLHFYKSKVRRFLVSRANANLAQALIDIEQAMNEPQSEPAPVVAEPAITLESESAQLNIAKETQADRARRRQPTLDRMMAEEKVNLSRNKWARAAFPGRGSSYQTANRYYLGITIKPTFDSLVRMAAILKEKPENLPL